MDSVQLLGGQCEYFLDIVSSLSWGLEESIDFIFLLELYGSISCDLTAVFKNQIFMKYDRKVNIRLCDFYFGEILIY